MMVSSAHCLLLLGTVFTVALIQPTNAQGKSSQIIPWRDQSSLIAVDGMGAFLINGRTGVVNSTINGPFYAPQLQDISLFGNAMDEFQASAKNSWFINGQTAATSQIQISYPSDLLEGFSCVKDPRGLRIYCTGGFAKDQTTHDLSVFAVDINKSTMALNMTRFGFAKIPQAASLGRVGRALHASAIINNKIYLFGGMPCRFCSQPPWGVKSTAIIDVSNPYTPSLQWVEASVADSAGSKLADTLTQFAGSCAVPLPDGQALIVGGISQDPSSGSINPLTNLWVFNPATFTYTPVLGAQGQAPTPGWGISCAVSADGKKVYVHGGCDPSLEDDASSFAVGGPTDGTVYVLDVSTAGQYIWSSTAAAPDAPGAPGPRCFGSASVYNGLLLLFGGQKAVPADIFLDKGIKKKSAKEIAVSQRNKRKAKAKAAKAKATKNRKPRKKKNRGKKRNNRAEGKKGKGKKITSKSGRNSTGTGNYSSTTNTSSYAPTSPTALARKRIAVVAAILADPGFEADAARATREAIQMATYGLLNANQSAPARGTRLASMATTGFLPLPNNNNKPVTTAGRKAKSPKARQSAKKNKRGKKNKNKNSRKVVRARPRPKPKTTPKVSARKRESSFRFSNLLRRSPPRHGLFVSDDAVDEEEALNDAEPAVEEEVDVDESTNVDEAAALDEDEFNEDEVVDEEVVEDDEVVQEDAAVDWEALFDLNAAASISNADTPPPSGGDGTSAGTGFFFFSPGSGSFLDPAAVTSLADPSTPAGSGGGSGSGSGGSGGGGSGGSGGGGGGSGGSGGTGPGSGSGSGGTTNPVAPTITTKPTSGGTTAAGPGTTPKTTTTTPTATTTDTPATPLASSPNASPGTSNSTSASTGLPAGLVAGIIAGCVVLALALAIGAWIAIRTFNRRRNSIDKADAKSFESGASAQYAPQPRTPDTLDPPPLAFVSPNGNGNYSGPPPEMNDQRSLPSASSSKFGKISLSSLFSKPKPVTVKKPGWEPEPSTSGPGAFFVIRTYDPAGNKIDTTSEIDVPVGGNDVTNSSTISSKRVSVTPKDLANALTVTQEPVMQRRATGRVKVVGQQRFLDLSKNTIIPLLAPIEELVEFAPNKIQTTAGVLELSARFESLIFEELGDLNLIPLDSSVPAALGLEIMSLPLRSSSYNSTGEGAVELPEEMQTTVKFQCMYCHTPRTNDELKLRFGDVVMMQRFYKDAWAYGTNYSLQMSGFFPIFCVEESNSPISVYDELPSASMPPREPLQ